MNRCNKCEGCTNMWDEYRPHWCEDENCSEGKEDPNKARHLELTRRLLSGDLKKEDFE